MADNKKQFGEFSYEDIQLYLSGKMSPARMNALEKAALDDPFLADAIEGFTNTDLRNLSQDIDDLKQKLQEKTRTLIVPIRKKDHLWRNIAASTVILLGIGFTIYFLNRPIENPVANKFDKNQNKPAPASAEKKSVNTDSTTSSLIDDGKRSNATRPEKDIIKLSDSPHRVTVSPKKPQELINPAIASESNSAPATNTDTVRDVARANLLSKIDSSPGRGVQAEDKNASGAIAIAPEMRKVKKEADANYAYATNTRYIKGKIADNNNNGVPFANIRILNSNKNIYSDAAGYFSLVSADTVLDISVKSIGFVSKRASLYANGMANTITLAPSGSVLEEITANSTRTQKNNADNSEIEDQEASPLDGWDNYDVYILNNLRIPSDAVKNDVHGDVELSFTVNKYGIPSDFKIEKGLSQSCNKEAIRVVREGPKWELKKALKSGTVKLSISFQ